MKITITKQEAIQAWKDNNKKVLENIENCEVEIETLNPMPIRSFSSEFNSPVKMLTYISQEPAQTLEVKPFPKCINQNCNLLAIKGSQSPCSCGYYN